MQGWKKQGPSAFSAVARKFPVLLEKSREVSIFTLERRESVFSEVMLCNDRFLMKIGNNNVVLVWPWFRKNNVSLPLPLLQIRSAFISKGKQSLFDRPF